MPRLLTKARRARAICLAFVRARWTGRHWAKREAHRAWLRANWHHLSPEERAKAEAWLDADHRALMYWRYGEGGASPRPDDASPPPPRRHQ